MGALIVTKNKLAKSKAEVDRLQNNVEYFEGRLKGEIERNNVFRASLSDLLNSNDSLIVKAKKVALKQNVKLSAVSTATVVETVVRDTMYTTLKDTVDKNFNVTIQYNDQTSILVSREDSLVTVIPDIRNTQTLIIYTDRQYKYKKFITRLLKLNFKKTTTTKYVIDNSNDLLKVEDARVIEVSD